MGMLNISLRLDFNQAKYLLIKNIIVLSSSVFLDNMPAL